MERALFHAARGARAHQPESAGRRGRRVGRTAWSSGRASTSAPAKPHAEVHALADGRRARARRDAVLHARAVLPPRPHRPVRQPDRRRRHRRASSRRSRIRIRAVRGRGFAFLRAHGVDGRGRAVGARRAVALNQPFFTLMREGRPFVILKAATSLDGRIAAAPGRRTPLTSAAANRHAHRVRAEVDAIGVGVGTILADDPVLTRARRLPRAAADPRHLRPPPADAAGRARALDTRRRACHHRDDGRGGGARRAAQRALEARGAEIEVAADGTFRAALRAPRRAADRLAAARRRRGAARGGVGRRPRRLRAALRHAARARRRRRAAAAGPAVFVGGARASGASRRSVPTS